MQGYVVKRWISDLNKVILVENKWKQREENKGINNNYQQKPQ